ncbi:hypothetical protein ACTL32_06970 [Planococcus sp. FY231025]|uniref:hypothetical protein n=1 Tax=Planococcus sp. FY231025 TaxID=3455699 RepID=UPI003F927732
MKSIRKFLVLFVVLVALSIMSFLLIFNQGLIGGLMLAAMAALFSAVLFAAGIAGVLKGKLDFFRIRNTWEAVGTILFAVIFFTVVSVVTVANSFVEFTAGETNLAHREKMRLFASTIFQVPAQKELVSEEKNGVTYYVMEENKNEIEKMEGLLAEQREELNAFFGTDDSGGLAIEFHEDYESMEELAGIEDVSAFYNTLNRTIHLVPDDAEWETVLVHEYTHYQSHLFALENGLPISHLPHWFEEGIAEYFAEAGSFWYDLETIRLADFRSMDDLEDFDASSTAEFDPYAQAYLAVKALVDDYGEEVILELMVSESVRAFYSMFEEKTGQSIEEFQETFLEEMIAEQREMKKMFDSLYAAMEAKQDTVAEGHFQAIENTGDAYDIDEAYWIMADFYLEQELYSKAAELMNAKTAKGDERFLIDDLLLLAEIHLISNPKKSLELAERAEQEALASGDMDYYDFDSLIAAYQKINSANAAGGYKMLFEEELIYNIYVIEDLESKLKKEFPEQF